MLVGSPCASAARTRSVVLMTALIARTSAGTSEQEDIETRQRRSGCGARQFVDDPHCRVLELFEPDVRQGASVVETMTAAPSGTRLRTAAGGRGRQEAVPDRSTAGTPPRRHVVTPSASRAHRERVDCAAAREQLEPNARDIHTSTRSDFVTQLSHALRRQCDRCRIFDGAHRRVVVHRADEPSRRVKLTD